MFLLERLFGISVFLSGLFVFAYLISKKKTIRSTKKIIFAYIAFLFILGYFFKPYITADLYRTNEIISSNLTQKSFSEMISIVKESGRSFYYVYYWIFGKIGNLHLLPAVTAAIFYSNVFYIIYKSSIKFNASTKTMALTIIFFMTAGQFVEVISGIKSMLAFSVIALCCYREFVEGKSMVKDLPLYVFAALMHDAALIAVGIRFVYLAFQKESKIYLKIRNYAILATLSFIALKYGNTIISNAISKSQGYITGDAYSYFWEYVIGIICNLFLIYTLYLAKRITKIDHGYKAKISKHLNFLVIILFLDVVFSFEYSIFHRYTIFASILAAPIVLITLKESSNMKYAFLRRYQGWFMLYLIATMALVNTRGNMTGLKFFELSANI